MILIINNNSNINKKKNYYTLAVNNLGKKKYKVLNNALAIVFADLFGIGIVTKYLVKSHINVIAYSFRFIELGNGAIVSAYTVLNGKMGVSVSH